ncbi:MAG: Eco57I restriction-modification methylase domain-containing protein [Acidobacteriota bacterium]|nr:Eco57I restriction-modification methylase domain-containing protein [Acidobacteriota bacterium]
MRQELISDQKPALQKTFPEVFNGIADLYIYFYARAVQILSKNGMLCFISPNKWLRAGYGSTLRSHAGNVCAVRSIVDFGDLPVFQSAIAYSMIFVAQKQRTRDQSPVFTMVTSLEPPFPDIRALVVETGEELDNLSASGPNWVIVGRSIADKVSIMRKAGPELGNYLGSRVYMGLKMGPEQGILYRFRNS